MASIWRDIQIEWEGEKYTIRPTLDFINYLERDDGCSLSKMVVRLARQDLPSAAACSVVSKTLTYAGCNVTAEQVFQATNGGLGGDLVEMSSAILLACMPQHKTEAAAPAKKKPASRK